MKIWILIRGLGDQIAISVIKNSSKIHILTRGGNGLTLLYF